MNPNSAPNNPPPLLFEGGGVFVVPPPAEGPGIGVVETGPVIGFNNWGGSPSCFRAASTNGCC